MQDLSAFENEPEYLQEKALYAWCDERQEKSHRPYLNYLEKMVSEPFECAKRHLKREFPHFFDKEKS